MASDCAAAWAATTGKPRLRRMASLVRWRHHRVEGNGYALEESGTAGRPL